MRTELYEQYKTENPEEMVKINRLFAYDGYVTDRRKAAQSTKLTRVEEWERRLANE